jgi:Domain of unknown function (DUF4169)
MTGEIINLRRARKRRAREDDAARAAENRARFGRTKAQKERDEIERQRLVNVVDGAERAPDPSSDKR